MKAPVEITIVIEKEDADKLLALAVDQSLFSEYLSKLIQRAYKESQLVGSDAGIEQLIKLAEWFADQNTHYKEAVGILHERLRKLTMSQEELMATLDHLRGTSPSPRNADGRTID